eukprot:GHVR01060261.1.p1 GENE.GHVR01060261.1~~GHVR01060261.1.p1  ORF type:complete len:175 (+),score=42.79 GHVR01060261.1:240-764(+)
MCCALDKKDCRDTTTVHPSFHGTNKGILHGTTRSSSSSCCYCSSCCSCGGYCASNEVEMFVCDILNNQIITHNWKSVLGVLQFIERLQKVLPSFARHMLLCRGDRQDSSGDLSPVRMSIDTPHNESNLGHPMTTHNSTTHNSTSLMGLLLEILGVTHTNGYNATTGDTHTHTHT